jgi:predicted MPP superfamily phosphohydrolase
VPSSLTVREYPVTLDVPALKGLRIAVLADLHAGAPYIDEAKIDQVVARTNAARPDLILLAGDYSGGDTMAGTWMEFDTIARHLERLEAPLGVFAVLGNHDGADQDGIGGALERSGIFVLRNFHVVMDTRRGAVVLAGIGDRESRRDNVGRALGNLPATVPVLCLTHSPDLFPELPKNCVLTMAGHTHGGQVALPFLGRPIVPSRFGRRYAQGLVREGGKTLFVSSGIGTSTLPVRLGVTPEISLLKIQ